MAEFCLDCSKELFGEDSDFKGIISEEMSHEGWVAPVLCEGCGFIEVDHLGKKVEDNVEQKQKRKE